MDAPLIFTQMPAIVFFFIIAFSMIAVGHEEDDWKTEYGGGLIGIVVALYAAWIFII